MAAAQPPPFLTYHGTLKSNEEQIILRTAAPSDSSHDFSGAKLAALIKKLKKGYNPQCGIPKAVFNARLDTLEEFVKKNKLTNIWTFVSHPANSSVFNSALPRLPPGYSDVAALPEDKLLSMMKVPMDKIKGALQIHSNWKNAATLSTNGVFECDGISGSAGDRGIFSVQYGPRQRDIKARAVLARYFHPDGTTTLGLQPVYSLYESASGRPSGDGVRRIVLMYDASFLQTTKFLTNLPQFIPGFDSTSKYEVFLLESVANTMDPATKPNKFERSDAAPNITIYMLQEADQYAPVEFPAFEQGTPMSDFYSNMKIQLQREQDGSITATFTLHDGSVFVVKNAQDVSEINNAGYNILFQHILSDNSLTDEQKEDIFRMIKRMGDWLQGIILTDGNRVYKIVRGVNSTGDIPTEDLPTISITLNMLRALGAVIGLVTHDRILAAFCVFMGIVLFYTMKVSVSDLPSLAEKDNKDKDESEDQDDNEDEDDDSDKKRSNKAIWIVCLQPASEDRPAVELNPEQLANLKLENAKNTLRASRNKLVEVLNALDYNVPDGTKQDITGSLAPAIAEAIKALGPNFYSDFEEYIMKTRLLVYALGKIVTPIPPLPPIPAEEEIAEMTEMPNINDQDQQFKDVISRLEPSVYVYTLLKALRNGSSPRVIPGGPASVKSEYKTAAAARDILAKGKSIAVLNQPINNDAYSNLYSLVLKPLYEDLSKFAPNVKAVLLGIIMIPDKERAGGRFGKAAEDMKAVINDGYQKSLVQGGGGDVNTFLPLTTIKYNVTSVREYSYELINEQLQIFVTGNVAISDTDKVAATTQLQTYGHSVYDFLMLNTDIREPLLAECCFEVVLSAFPFFLSSPPFPSLPYTQLPIEELMRNPDTITIIDSYKGITPINLEIGTPFIEDNKEWTVVDEYIIGPQYNYETFKAAFTPPFGNTYFQNFAYYRCKIYIVDTLLQSLREDNYIQMYKRLMALNAVKYDFSNLIALLGAIHTNNSTFFNDNFSIPVEEEIDDVYVVEYTLRRALCGYVIAYLYSTAQILAASSSFDKHKPTLYDLMCIINNICIVPAHWDADVHGYVPEVDSILADKPTEIVTIRNAFEIINFVRRPPPMLDDPIFLWRYANAVCFAEKREFEDVTINGLITNLLSKDYTSDIFNAALEHETSQGARWSAVKVLMAIYMLYKSAPISSIELNYYESSHILHILYRYNRTTAATLLPSLIPIIGIVYTYKLLKEFNHSAWLFYNYITSRGDISDKLIPDDELAIVLLQRLGDDISSVKSIAPSEIVSYTSTGPPKQPWEYANTLNILYLISKGVATSFITTDGMLTIYGNPESFEYLNRINPNALAFYVYISNRGDLSSVINPLYDSDKGGLADLLLRQLAEDIVPLPEITPGFIIHYIQSRISGGANPTDLFSWEYANTLNILYMKDKAAAAALVNPDAWRYYGCTTHILDDLMILNPHAAAFYSYIRTRTPPSDASLRAQLLDDLAAATTVGPLPPQFGGYHKRTTRRKNKRTKSTKRIIVITKRKTRQAHRKPMKTRVTIKKKK